MLVELIEYLCGRSAQGVRVDEPIAARARNVVFGEASHTNYIDRVGNKTILRSNLLSLTMIEA
jgi:hypothetical protein